MSAGKMLPVLVAVVLLVLALAFLATTDWGEPAPPERPAAEGGTVAVEPPTGTAEPEAGPRPEREKESGEDWVEVRLSGRVLHPDGSPAAGARVYLGGRWDPVPPVEWRHTPGEGPDEPGLCGFALSGPDGRYTTPGPPFAPYGPPFDHPSDYRVTAVLDDLVATGEPFEAEDGGYRMPDLLLEGGFRVEGRVVDAAGEPVEGVMAWLQAQRKRGDIGDVARRAARSDEEGRLAFPPVPLREDWSLSITFRHDGYLPQEESVELGTSPPVWTLSTGCVLRGLVAGPDGEPAAGVQVVPAEERGDGWLERTSLCARTDDEGRFFMPVAPAGRIRLHLYPGLAAEVGSRMASGAFPHVTPRLETRAGRDLDLGALRYDAAGSIRGSVLGPDGHPLEVAEVRLICLGTGKWRQRATSADGSVAFGDLPPGRYALELQGAQGRSARAGEVEVLPGRETGVELSLR